MLHRQVHRHARVLLLLLLLLPMRRWRCCRPTKVGHDCDWLLLLWLQLLLRLLHVIG
jgi:hypothetical protein